MSPYRERAATLLTHYLKTAHVNAGVHWDADNDGEVEEIIDALHDMVVEQVQEHSYGTPHPYPDGSTA